MTIPYLAEKDKLAYIETALVALRAMLSSLYTFYSIGTRVLEDPELVAILQEIMTPEQRQALQDTYTWTDTHKATIRQRADILQLLEEMPPLVEPQVK